MQMTEKSFMLALKLGWGGVGGEGQGGGQPQPRWWRHYVNGILHDSQWSTGILNTVHFINSRPQWQSEIFQLACLSIMLRADAL